VRDRARSGTALTGKAAVITGGGRGIGRAIALRFAEEGARVVVVDSGVDVDGMQRGSSDPAAEVVAAIRSRGGEAIACSVDVATLRGANRTVKAALEAFGRVDAMVCCAGILIAGRIQEMPARQWDEVIRVHLRGHFACTRAAARPMIAQKSGCILYFSSAAALSGSAEQPSYVAAKAAILGLVTSSARSLGPHGITVNCILPGGATRMTDLIWKGRVTGEVDLTLPSDQASGTWRDPANVATMPVFLVSDRGRQVTGQAFGVVGQQVTQVRLPSYGITMKSESPWSLSDFSDAFMKTFGLPLGLTDMTWPPG
jgi:NAD(P)-dependent dehydrogenase (short-subunit alcohol dehydrogenase family)